MFDVHVLQYHTNISVTAKLSWFVYIYSYSTFVPVFKIKRHKRANVARASGFLMVKILNKCILIILVNNLCLDKQRNI